MALTPESLRGDAARHLLALIELIDAAKVAQGIQHDRELSRRLGFVASPVHMWRVNKAWPSRDAILRLAALAERDPDLAVADLLVWTAKGEAELASMKRIREIVARHVRGAAAAIALGFALAGGLAAPAAAGTQSEQSNPGGNRLYIMGK